MPIPKNKICALYDKDGNECLLTGWYRMHSNSKLKVCMDAPFAGLSTCREIEHITQMSTREQKAEAIQCLRELFEEALEIMRYRPQLERVLARFYQKMEIKKQKRLDLVKRQEQAADDIERCMIGLMLDRFGDNQCELYDLLETEGVFIDTDLSNIFITIKK